MDVNQIVLRQHPFEDVSKLCRRSLMDFPQRNLMVIQQAPGITVGIMQVTAA